LKVVHVIFESQFEPEIISLLHRELEVPRYLRLDNLNAGRAVEREGRRAYRVDDRNSLIIVLCDDDLAEQIISGVTNLRQRLGHGVHAYAMPAEQVV
jgi:hypothetical protein